MISFNKYAILAIVGAVLLSLALVRAEGEADEQPEENAGVASTNVPNSVGPLGKLITGARNAISHIPVIGKYTSSAEKNVVGGDDTTTLKLGESTSESGEKIERWIPTSQDLLTCMSC